MGQIHHLQVVIPVKTDGAATFHLHQPIKIHFKNVGKYTIRLLGTNISKGNFPFSRLDGICEFPVPRMGTQLHGSGDGNFMILQVVATHKSPPQGDPEVGERMQVPNSRCGEKAIIIFQGG